MAPTGPPANPMRPTSAEVEQELVAYIHGEQTSIPYPVIEEYIAIDPVVRDAHAELIDLVQALGHLPTVTPSKDFVRRVASQLPRLRAEGKTTRRIEDMVLRMQWTLEDRVVFIGEYWRHRFRQRPVASIALVAAAVALLLTAAWLPGVLTTPGPDIHTPNPVAPNDPDSPGDTADNPDQPGLPGPNPWVRPEEVNNDRRSGPGITFDRMPKDDPTVSADRDEIERSRPRYDAIEHSEPSLPVDPTARLTRGTTGLRITPLREVAPWFERREQPDPVRSVGGRERRMIEEALRWLAAHQNTDGSFGAMHLNGSHSDRNGVSLAQDSPLQIQTTARALLAFLADNYSSREALTEALQPRKSAYSPIGAMWDKQVDRFRAVVHKGLQYLMANSDPDTGRIGAAGDGCIVAHSEALAALAEDIYICNNWRLRETVQAGVRFLLETRNADGGWGAAPGMPSRLRSTIAAVQALLIYSATRGAVLVDLTSPVFRYSARYVESCTREDGHANETPDWSVGTSLPRSTAGAIAAGHLLWNCGVAEPHTGFWAMALDLITAEAYRPQWLDSTVPPTAGDPAGDFDYWLFVSQALSGWDRSAANRVWAKVNGWRDSMIEMFEEHQLREDDQPQKQEQTCWDPIGFAKGKDRAWSTATACLSLQNRYRYAWLKRN